eukprot:scaffold2028_cov353-Pavlova_lutheri.AAC.11
MNVGPPYLPTGLQVPNEVARHLLDDVPFGMDPGGGIPLCERDASAMDLPFPPEDRQGGLNVGFVGRTELVQPPVPVAMFLKHIVDLLLCVHELGMIASQSEPLSSLAKISFFHYGCHAWIVSSGQVRAVAFDEGVGLSHQVVVDKGEAVQRYAALAEQHEPVVGRIFQSRFEQSLFCINHGHLSPVHGLAWYFPSHKNIGFRGGLVVPISGCWMQVHVVQFFRHVGEEELPQHFEFHGSSGEEEEGHFGRLAGLGWTFEEFHRSFVGDTGHGLSVHVPWQVGHSVPVVFVWIVSMHAFHGGFEFVPSVRLVLFRPFPIVVVGIVRVPLVWYSTCEVSTIPPCDPSKGCQGQSTDPSEDLSFPRAVPPVIHVGLFRCIEVGWVQKPFSLPPFPLLSFRGWDGSRKGIPPPFPMNIDGIEDRRRPSPPTQSISMG